MTISNPTDISGLRLWLSADAITPQTDNTNLTANWADQSGLGNDGVLSGTVKYRTGGGPAGGPSLQFVGNTGGGGWFSIPAGAFTGGITEIEMFAQTNSAADGTDPYPGAWNFQGGPTLETHFPYTPNGTIYDASFSTTRWNFTPSPGVVGAWRRIHIASMVNAYLYRIDETNNVNSSATQTPYIPSTSGAVIGAGYFGGIDQRFKGRFTTFLIYDRELTSGERADIITWMSANPSGGVPAAAPGDPEDPAVTAATAHSLTFTWAAPSTGGAVSAYQVRLDGGSPVWVGLGFSHVFTGLDPVTTYTVEVRATGSGGESAWVGVDADTTTTPPPGWYRVEIDLADDGVFETPSHSWSVERFTEAEPGPMLPLTLGWVIPDQTAFFPAPADPTTLGFRVLVEQASDLATLTEGVSSVHMRMYVDPEPGADPWQDFTGILTQLDGEAVQVGDTLMFRATVYAGDDTMRLNYHPVGYTEDWPQESIGDRVERIAAEAGLSVDIHNEGGLEGTLGARAQGTTNALAALRDALKDAASDNTSTPPYEWYGRYVVTYDLATSTIHIWSFERRVFSDSTLTMDGTHFRATASWAKLPGPAAATWVTVDGITFGTPDGRPPVIVNTSLVDTTPSNPSAQTRDNLGESLLPDGSTMLDGWYSRGLRCLAHLDGAAELVDHLPSLAPCRQVIPVVVTPLNEALEVNGDDYLAGTLIGARLTIPPGGDYYVDLTLRPELLPGTDLP